MFTLADDEGRARAASRMLASLLYPYDDDAPALIGGWLDELERQGMIRRYVVAGYDYLEIAKWLEHQKIDRPTKSKIPTFVEGSRVIARDREPSALDQGSRTKDQGPRTEEVAVADEPRTGSLIAKAASDLAEQLLIIAGHDPAFWPPGWCGAPLRVQTWLNQGWSPEIITAAVKGAAARKTGAPAASVQFFEKAIAEEVARQRAPVPVVEVKPAQTVRIASHGRPQAGNVIQAADRLVETLNRFDDGPGLVDQIRSGARPAPARLLSAG
ncbi:hypothetical protein [Bradyrhizobium sp. SZCCHNS2015]|uniref:hypothetical protein n=1 Tax=Bradyrhizobium sp. SZCCHNS2015 TaxID=3057305 RepID=UPI0028E5F580|nr:hypothetical protein [Bradyrhizobium sp. SZCCHNS2015]